MARAKRKGAPRVARARPRAPANPIELVLYISASSRYALTAQRNCAALLSSFDTRRLRFEVCDISREPERAEADAVCYTPMLVKRRPLPRTYVLGDLSNADAVLTLLRTCGLEPRR